MREPSLVGPPTLGEVVTAVVRRWWVVVVCVVLAAAVAHVAVTHRARSYAASTKVSIHESSADPHPDPAAEANTITSDQLLGRALVLLDGDDHARTQVQTQVRVGVAGHQLVIDIIAETPDARRSYDLSHTLAEVYLAARAEAARAFDEGRVRAIDAERAGLVARTMAGDDEAQRLRAQLATVAPTIEALAERDRIERRIASITTQRSLDTARITQLDVERTDTISRTAGGYATGEVLRWASIPDRPLGTPDSRVRLAIIFVGAIVGILASVVLVRRSGARELRQRVSDELGVPVIAKVAPRPRRARREPVIDLRDDAYLGARVHVARSLEADEARTLLVVPHRGRGADAEDHAVRLALASARAGRTTVLLSTDFARPDLASRLSIPPGQTLADVLLLGEEVSPSRVDGTILDILAAGPRDSEVRDLLGSARMDALLRELETSHDLVIVEASSPLSSADTDAIAGLVQHAVLTLPDDRRAQRAGCVTRDLLARAGCRTLGVIVSGRR